MCINCIIEQNEKFLAEGKPEECALNADGEIITRENAFLPYSARAKEIEILCETEKKLVKLITQYKSGQHCLLLDCIDNVQKLRAMLT